jgi:DNA-binding transcriptional MerR regulator
MTVLSVSEAAQAVGLTTYTLRWYEQEGLLRPPARDSAGRRQYSEADIVFLTLLTKLKRTGMTVADMRRYAELIHRGPATVSERKRLMLAHRQRVLDQIAALHRDLEAVDRKIKRYTELEREQR